MRRWPVAMMALVVLSGCAGPAAPAPVESATPVYEGTYEPIDPTSTASAPSGSPFPSADPTPTSATPTPSHASSTPRPSASKGQPTAGRPVIVIDPGHSGRSIRSRTTNGLLDFDYPNYPEITEMFDISACVAKGLRADGYRVILTKKRASDSVSLTERADIANRAKADLAISVHDDHGQGPSFQATYSQRGLEHGGGYHAMYRGSGARRTVFDRPSVAKASERAARIIAAERAKAQRRPVSVRENSFNGRAPLEPGNLALVQLLSKVPWVYNELGALTGGSTTKRLTLDAETGYAKGLLDGVEAAVPSEREGRPTSTAELRSCLRSRRA